MYAISRTLELSYLTLLIKVCQHQKVNRKTLAQCSRLAQFHNLAFVKAPILQYRIRILPRGARAELNSHTADPQVDYDMLRG